VSDAGLKEHVGFIYSWVTLISTTDPRSTDSFKSTDFSTLTNFGTFTDLGTYTGVPMPVFSPFLVSVPIPETLSIGTDTEIPTIFLSNLTTDTEIPVDPNRPNAHP
jgi:hypothetical protein